MLELSYWFVLLLLHFASPQEFLQVPCTQSYENFARNFNTDCSSPCYVVCHNGCTREYNSNLVTGDLFYTSSTPICIAALYQGTIGEEGGSFTVRSSGDMEQFASGRSKLDGKMSQSSTFSQPSWFIEPYERLRFIEEPQDTTVLLGDPIVLTCRVNERVLSPRITWYNDDVEVAWSSKTDCTGEVCSIPRSGKNNGGNWQCKVATEFSGTMFSRTARVTVAYLNATFSYQPTDPYRADIDYNRWDRSGTSARLSDAEWPLVLPCLADSEPPAIITWYKNEVPLEEKNIFQTDRGSLFFIMLEDKDSGDYKCKAYNTVTQQTIESATRRVRQEAAAARPGGQPSSIVSSISSSTVRAHPGETVRLTCVATGNPIPDITWTVPDTLRNSERVSQSMFARNLVIRDVRVSDSGEYKCTATNEHDYMFGASFYFRVLVVTSPVFSVVPNDRTYDRGDRVELKCGLQNIGALEWIKDGQSVTLRESKITMNGNYLVINDVNEEDEGMYQCTADYAPSPPNRFAAQSSAFITVRSPPKIVVSNSALLFDQGDDIVMRCTARGRPYPFVVWYKDEALLRYSDRIRMTDIQTLRIDRAWGGDCGMYTCVAYNSLGKAHLSRTLTVIAKATIESVTASDDRGYYMSGDKIQLTCIVTGSRDVNVTWIKDNDTKHPLKSDISLKISQSGKYVHDFVKVRNVLEIEKCSTKDEGRYRCEASNYLGSDRAEVRVRVYTYMIPPKLMSGPIYTVVTEDNNMLVKCDFTGIPPPRVVWRREDEILSSSGRILITTSEDGLTSNLVIRDAVRADSGNFSCEGFNSAGATDRGTLPIEINYSSSSGLKNSAMCRSRMSSVILATVVTLVFVMVTT